MQYEYDTIVLFQVFALVKSRVRQCLCGLLNVSVLPWKTPNCWSFAERSKGGPARRYSCRAGNEFGIEKCEPYDNMHLAGITPV